MIAALRKSVAVPTAILTRRRRLAAAIEAAIDVLDSIDDTDQDVGCEDEGWDSDSEPHEDLGSVCTYDGDNQTRILVQEFAGHRLFYEVR